MRSMDREIQRRSNEDESTIWNGAKNSRKSNIFWASRFIESKTNEDLMIMIKGQNMEDSRMTKVLCLKGRARYFLLLIVGEEVRHKVNQIE